LIKIGAFEIRIMDEPEQVLDKPIGEPEEQLGLRYLALMTGPSEIQLEVGLTIFDDFNGEVKTLDHGTAPLPYSRLTHGCRMTVYKRQDFFWSELRYAKLNEQLWSNLAMADINSLSHLLDLPLQQTLLEYGALQVGTREEILGDTHNRRNQLCVTFPADNFKFPLIAYGLTRPIALLKQMNSDLR
jgi:hypothetical protein